MGNKKCRIHAACGVSQTPINRYLCEEITMRKCIRCECEMRENYDVKVEYGAYGLKITKQGIFKDNLGKVRVAVCPECGYLEFYLEDTSKLKN